MALRASNDSPSSVTSINLVPSQNEAIDKMETSENSIGAPTTESQDINNLRFKWANQDLIEIAAANGAKTFNIFINSSTTKTLPCKDPRVIQQELKAKIKPAHLINNLRVTRHGQVLISTCDVQCAIEACGISDFLGLPVFTRVITENVTNRFLLLHIPVATPLRDLAQEITDVNGLTVYELRRFVKRNTSPEYSPVLVTIIGTCLKREISLWYTLHRITQFIDKPRQCNKCHKFTHNTSKCDLQQVLCSKCGSSHEGLCAAPISCCNCGGEHGADDVNCPARMREAAFMTYKCSNFLSFTEARRTFSVNGNKDSYAKKTSGQMSGPADWQAQLASHTVKFEQLVKNLIPQIVESVVAKVVEVMSQQLVTTVELMYEKVASAIGSKVSDVFEKFSVDFKTVFQRLDEIHHRIDKGLFRTPEPEPPPKKKNVGSSNFRK